METKEEGTCDESLIYEIRAKKQKSEEKTYVVCCAFDSARSDLPPRPLPIAHGVSTRNDPLSLSHSFA